MKNHIKIDGKLLQTNKKWSQLKQNQWQWISEITLEEYRKYIAGHKVKPFKYKKDVIVDVVYERINEREIWIPYHEAKAAIYKIIDRQNRIVEIEIRVTPNDVSINNARKLT